MNEITPLVAASCVPPVAILHFRLLASIRDAMDVVCWPHARPSAHERLVSRTRVRHEARKRHETAAIAKSARRIQGVRPLAQRNAGAPKGWLRVSLSGGTMTIDDAAFLQALENCSLDPARFDHLGHLRMAWLYLRRDGIALGGETLRRTIQRFAAHVGSPGKYDDAVTTAWIARVDAALANAPPAEPFEAWLARHPLFMERTPVDPVLSPPQGN